MHTPYYRCTKKCNKYFKRHVEKLIDGKLVNLIILVALIIFFFYFSKFRTNVLEYKNNQ